MTKLIITFESQRGYHIRWEGQPEDFNKALNCVESASEISHLLRVLLLNAKAEANPNGFST